MWQEPSRTPAPTETPSCWMESELACCSTVSLPSDLRLLLLLLLFLFFLLLLFLLPSPSFWMGSTNLGPAFPAEHGRTCSGCLAGTSSASCFAANVDPSSCFGSAGCSCSFDGAGLAGGQSVAAPWMDLKPAAGPQPGSCSRPWPGSEQNSDCLGSVLVHQAVCCLCCVPHRLGLCLPQHLLSSFQQYPSSQYLQSGFMMLSGWVLNWLLPGGWKYLQELPLNQCP